MSPRRSSITADREPLPYDLDVPREAQLNPRVGPVIFADETARAELVDTGYVVTFREGDPRTTGVTHWRKGRTEPGEGGVEIWRITDVDPTDKVALAPYLPDSGFATIADWQDAIGALNGGTNPGHLYLVLTIGYLENEAGTDADAEGGEP